MEHPSPARQAYITQLADLENELLDMANRSEVMVDRAVKALVSLDKSGAYAVMQADDEIDRRDLEIEQKCLKLLALQQPIGSDLREIGTIMKIITDIERIGDLSVDIAKIGIKIDAEMGATNYVDLPRIADVSRQMVREAIQAFVKRDVTSLQPIAALEDEVDALYRDFRSQIHEYMVQNPDQVISASWMLLAIHHIERIADHALNIAERVGFMVTGNLAQLSHSHLSDSPEM